MSRLRWWYAVLLLSACVLALDLITGPYILFPIVFVFPVTLASWYLGRRAGVFFAFTLVASRLLIAVTTEAQLMPAWAAGLNAGIRLVVLSGIALLVDRVLQQQRALTERVQTLEGFLTICAFCKKIRIADGQWQQIEVYVSQRSAAQFSHGFCEVCAHEHYGDFYSPK